MKKKHIGTHFDNFLKEEGMLAEITAAATKRVRTYKTHETMKSSYTAKEWTKIEKLASKKGKTFTTTKSAKDYLKSV